MFQDGIHKSFSFRIMISVLIWFCDGFGKTIFSTNICYWEYTQSIFSITWNIVYTLFICNKVCRNNTDFNILLTCKHIYIYWVKNIACWNALMFNIVYCTICFIHTHIHIYIIIYIYICICHTYTIQIHSYNTDSLA